MAKLTWDNTNEHFYETGVDQGVLFVKGDSGYGKGVAWSGLTVVTESPSGAESNKQYADNLEYLNLVSKEEFGGTIEAYQSPEAFDACDGSIALVPGLKIGQQTRKMFAFAYRTKVGNENGDDFGFKIHIVYNAKATPSERAYNTVNESPEAMTLSWQFTTTPDKLIIDDVEYKPVAHVEIDSRNFPDESGGGMNTKLKAVLDKLYGTDASGAETTGTDPELPTIAWLKTALT